ncbi:MAG TPA: alpha/beta fold hydrolase [Polyangia bacterium]|nr:alpha/beta fold hydrolase [Polyangia bacterium]
MQPTPDWRGFERVPVTVEDGTVLSAYHVGRRELPAILLVNAFGMPVRFWGPLARALSDRFFMVSWESRGVPSLDQPFHPDRCSLLDHAGDMRRVAEAFSLSGALAVAWCTGCQVALRCAAMPAPPIAGAVLLCGAYCLPDGRWTSQYGRNMKTIAKHCARSVAHAGAFSDILMSAAHKGSGSTQPAIGQAIPAEVLDMTMGPFASGQALYRYAHLQRQFLDPPPETWASEVRLPVLVLGAGKDQIVHPEASREIARRLPEAELLMLPEGDHFVHYFDPAVPAAIEDFHARRLSRSNHPRPAHRHV